MRPEAIDTGGAEQPVYFLFIPISDIRHTGEIGMFTAACERVVRGFAACRYGWYPRRGGSFVRLESREVREVADQVLALCGPGADQCLDQLRRVLRSECRLRARQLRRLEGVVLPGELVAQSDDRAIFNGAFSLELTSSQKSSLASQRERAVTIEGGMETC